MKSLLAILAMSFAFNFSYGQTTHLDTETFTYNSNTVYHYGLGWYVDSDASAYGPMAYLSAYGGIKFFTAGGVKGIIDVNGNMGIGTISPARKLEVAGIIRLPDNNQIEWGGANNYIYGSNANNLLAFATNSTEKMRIDINGNLAIGTTDTKGYKLAVNGSAIATSITVKEYANWPDYVFMSTYKLPKLSEVKAYIDHNQHLPDMPSATEIEKDGINLGEMVKLQTKKIEELTLYLIEKDKQLDQLNQKIDALKQEIRKNQ